MMAKAFQTNAFQNNYPGVLTAFQDFDRIVSTDVNDQSTIEVRDLFTLFIGPLMAEYKRTTAIVIECSVYDPSQEPSILFDPTSVQLTVINPDLTTLLNLVSMSKISTGFYRYIFQSASNNQLGVYEGNIKVTNGGNVSQSITQLFFKLV